MSPRSSPDTYIVIGQPATGDSGGLGPNRLKVEVLSVRTPVMKQ
jgi:hypothetical protein